MWQRGSLVSVLLLGLTLATPVTAQSYGDDPEDQYNDTGLPPPQPPPPPPTPNLVFRNVAEIPLPGPLPGDGPALRRWPDPDPRGGGDGQHRDRTGVEATARQLDSSLGFGRRPALDDDPERKASVRLSRPTRDRSAGLPRMPQARVEEQVEAESPGQRSGTPALPGQTRLLWQPGQPGLLREGRKRPPRLDHAARCAHLPAAGPLERHPGFSTGRRRADAGQRDGARTGRAAAPRTGRARRGACS